MRRMTIALLAAALVGAAGCGDDDDDVTGVLGSNDDTTTETSAAGGGAYTEAMREAFMTNCTVQGTEEDCGWTWDHIVENVPIDEFVAYDQAVRTNPSAQPPQGVVDAINACIR